MGTTTNFPGIKPFPSIQTITLVQAPIIFLLEFSKSILSDLSSSVLVLLCSIIHVDSVISAKYKPQLLPFLLKTLQSLPVGFRIEPKLLPVFFKALPYATPAPGSLSLFPFHAVCSSPHPQATVLLTLQSPHLLLCLPHCLY